MVLDESILKQYGGININSLDNILPRDIDAELQFLKTSHYYDDRSLADEFSNKINSFNILGLNCQSINAKVDELKIKLHQLKSINCEFNAIFIQETWLLDNAHTSLIELYNYTLISKVKTGSAHGGLLTKLL